MTYHICNLHDDRVLCIHRRFNRYYVRSMWDIPEQLTMFEEYDLKMAKAVLDDVKKRWIGSWVVVNTRGEVVA